MKEQFVPCKIALTLKELGFDEECLTYYLPNGRLLSNVIPDTYSVQKYNSSTNHIFRESNELAAAPLWQQVIDWFREKHNIHFHIDYIKQLNLYGVHFQNPVIKSISIVLDTYESYEEAREQAILEAIEIVKKRNNK